MKIRTDRKQFAAYLLMTLLILYQLVRIVAFVDEYGSVEHDGGWFLGVSRSLAERGTYTSLTSTVVDPNSPAALNIDKQFTIQDPEGREYFFIGNTTGPGIVLPNAIILKIFGFGFWQSRLGPLIFFCLFLILATAMLYAIQGIVAVIVFHLYLFFFPQLYIFLGYEAFGEVPSMVYLLLSFMLFVRAIQAENQPSAWFFASGILAGLAINTRLATIIAFGGFAIIWLILFRQKKITFKNALTLIAGLLAVAALWQLYIFITLMRVSNFSAYLNHVWGRFEFFQRSIKGITPVAEGMELFLLKAIILSEISYPNLWVSLVLALVTGLGGVLLIRQLWADPARRNMAILLWAAWLIYTLWFLNGPKNAWVRYYWYGLIWMAMLIGLMFAALIRQLSLKPGWFNGAGSLFLGMLLVFSFSTQPQAIHFFITPDLIEIWRQRQLATKDTYLPWIIIPRAEQEQVAQFIANLPPEAHIYYPEGHKTAELSFLTNRIFYTLPRRKLMGPHPDDVLIIGPAIISPWKKERQQRLDILETTHRECPAIVLETPNYIICAIGKTAQN